jgi:dienelactone hydrolase
MRRRDLLAGAAIAAAPKSEYDYVDWSWERWRKLTGETRPRVASEQSGKAELSELVRKDGTLADWSKRREGIERVLSVFLGTPPADKLRPNARVLEETRLSGYLRRKLEYETEPGEFVPAYLLVPDGLRGRAPAVLCPHQTMQGGKKSPAGLADDPSQHTALELVKRGYVTFTWDALCFGERHKFETGHYGEAIPFYRKHPRWSLLGKMIWDLSRGVDYLETLDFVDARRIGSTGHSHGGYTTLAAMALDKRIAAGAANCGFDTFRIDGNTFRWSYATALLPRAGFWVSSPHINMDFYRAVPDSEVVLTPFDMHEFVALAAPKPVLFSCSDEDFVFPNGGWSTRRAVARLEPLYALHKAPDRLATHYFRGGHSFPAAARERAYAWLDRWLK